MYDNITPEQWVIGLVVCLVVFAGLVWVLWHYFPSKDMSSADDERPRSSDMNPVYIPVSRYGIEPDGMKKSEVGVPDIDAENTGMSHFDRDITDGEWIVRMAVARGKDKKYRFSANTIHAAVGGDRNAVLARVKELRDGVPPPEFLQPDGTKVPATYPVTGRRTHA